MTEGSFFIPKEKYYLIFMNLSKERENLDTRTLDLNPFSRVAASHERIIPYTKSLRKARRTDSLSRFYDLAQANNEAPAHRPALIVHYLQHEYAEKLLLNFGEFLLTGGTEFLTRDFAISAFDFAKGIDSLLEDLRFEKRPTKSEVERGLLEYLQLTLTEDQKADLDTHFWDGYIATVAEERMKSTNLLTEDPTGVRYINYESMRLSYDPDLTFPPTPYYERGILFAADMYKLLYPQSEGITADLVL